jgi:hypothetical protein
MYTLFTHQYKGAAGIHFFVPLCIPAVTTIKTFFSTDYQNKQRTLIHAVLERKDIMFSVRYELNFQ